MSTGPTPPPAFAFDNSYARDLPGFYVDWQPAKAPAPVLPSRGVPTKLQVVSGPNAGQSVPLGDNPILLGRGTDAAIRLDDDYVSTRHARFATNGEQWFVEDLGSTNGTYLGSQRITSPIPIGIGIAVRLGKTIVELQK